MSCTDDTYAVNITPRSIEIDGVDISRYVVSAGLHIDGSHRPIVTLRLLPQGLRYSDSATLVRIEGEQAEVLEALGWAPPRGYPSPRADEQAQA